MTHKKLWNQEEDQILKLAVTCIGDDKWSQISKKYQYLYFESYKRQSIRSGKQCRQRWYNKLNPIISNGIEDWERQQQIDLLNIYESKGSKWSKIALGLIQSGYKQRSDNNIKNQFHMIVKKGIKQLNLFVDETNKQIKKSSSFKKNDKKYFYDRVYSLQRMIKRNMNKQRIETSQEKFQDWNTNNKKEQCDQKDFNVSEKKEIKQQKSEILAFQNLNSLVQVQKNETDIFLSCLLKKIDKKQTDRIFLLWSDKNEAKNIIFVGQMKFSQLSSAVSEILQYLKYPQNFDKKRKIQLVQLIANSSKCCKKIYKKTQTQKNKQKTFPSKEEINKIVTKIFQIILKQHRNIEQILLKSKSKWCDRIFRLSQDIIGSKQAHEIQFTKRYILDDSQKLEITQKIYQQVLLQKFKDSKHNSSQQNSFQQQIQQSLNRSKSISQFSQQNNEICKEQIKKQIRNSQQSQILIINKKFEQNLKNINPFEKKYKKKQKKKVKDSKKQILKSKNEKIKSNNCLNVQKVFMIGNQKRNNLNQKIQNRMKVQQKHDNTLTINQNQKQIQSIFFNQIKLNLNNKSQNNFNFQKQINQNPFQDIKLQTKKQQNVKESSESSLKFPSINQECSKKPSQSINSINSINSAKNIASSSSAKNFKSFGFIPYTQQINFNTNLNLHQNKKNKVPNISLQSKNYLHKSFQYQRTNKEGDNADFYTKNQLNFNDEKKQKPLISKIDFFQIDNKDLLKQNQSNRSEEQLKFYNSVDFGVMNSQMSEKSEKSFKNHDKINNFDQNIFLNSNFLQNIRSIQQQQKYEWKKPKVFNFQSQNKEQEFCAPFKKQQGSVANSSKGFTLFNPLNNLLLDFQVPQKLIETAKSPSFPLINHNNYSSSKYFHKNSFQFSKIFQKEKQFGFNSARLSEIDLLKSSDLNGQNRSRSSEHLSALFKSQKIQSSLNELNRSKKLSNSWIYSSFEQHERSQFEESQMGQKFSSKDVIKIGNIKIVKDGRKSDK